MEWVARRRDPDMERKWPPVSASVCYRPSQRGGGHECQPLTQSRCPSEVTKMPAAYRLVAAATKNVFFFFFAWTQVISGRT